MSFSSINALQTSVAGNISATNLLFRDATPSIVINQPYDISGNGGRKLIKLSNGWLVVGVIDSTNKYVRWYVSKDNGSTYTELLSQSRSNAPSAIAVVSSGTNIYTLVIDTANCALMKFDAIAPSLAVVYIDSGQTSYGSGCSLTIDSLGYLHATWSSTNATYPNSKNIRYSKSTDGGVTWATPTQVTVANTSGTDITNPSVVVDNANIPYIFVQFTNSTIKAIVVVTTKYSTRYWDTTNFGTWGGNQVVYNGSTYAQANPCSLTKKYGSNIGRIWTTWHGLDSTDTAKQNIRVSYSDDSGATWSAMAKITSGNTVDRKNATLTEDPSGNVYAVYDDNGTITYQICPNGSTTFGTVTAMSAGTNPQTLDNSSGTSFTKPPVVYMTMGSVQYDVAPRPQAVWSGIPPEIPIPLWWYSGSSASTTNTSASGSYLLAKGSTTLTASTNSQTKLHTLNSTWSTSIKYAIEAAIYNGTSSDITYMALWDITAGSIISSSQTSITSTTATMTRSAQFTLTPGHIYGVALWCNAGTAYITDASLIVFPS